MQLGLKLWNINTDFYFDDAQRLFNNGVYDYIELYIVPNNLETLKKWKTLDIPFIMHAPHSMNGFNLADSTREETNKEVYNEVKIFADALKARYIIFHGGMDNSIEETARQLKNFNEPRALIENKPFKPIPNNLGLKQCRGFNKEEIQYVMSAAGCGFCLDFGHAICAANSLKIDYWKHIDDFLSLKPSMYHLSDIEDGNSEIDSHPNIGTGCLDIRKILLKLEQDAMISIETNKNSKENLDDFVEDIENIRSNSN